MCTYAQTIQCSYTNEEYRGAKRVLLVLLIILDLTIKEYLPTCGHGVNKYTNIGLRVVDYAALDFVSYAYVLRANILVTVDFRPASKLYSITQAPVRGIPCVCTYVSVDSKGSL